MLRKLIPFAVLLLIIVSCTKTDVPDVVDYGPIDKKIIEDYLTAHNDTAAQFTASGLYYIIQKLGGDIHPTLKSVVTINYKGYLTDGTVFDATAAGKTVSYTLNELIGGWQEGLQLIGSGGKMRLFIPSKLGYGSYSQRKIPANSVIIFDIELVSFK